MAHQQYTTTLGEMTGRILSIKPNISPTLAQDFINDAIRVICDRKPDWIGLFVERDLYVPDMYNTGEVELTQGSTSVIGTGTSWDVDSIVNTTIPSGILRTGYTICTPASMDGIGVDTLLYVTDGSSEEVVAVKSITAANFTATFTKFFNPGATITSSTLAGRQIRFTNSLPIYTIRAVVDDSTLIIDNPWYADDLSSAYEIKKLYYTMEPGLKSIISIVDPTQGIPPLNILGTSQELNRMDPQRSATGYPQRFVARGPNENGNMQYEMWPAPVDARQLRAFINLQPPKLITEGDFLPSFINPTVVFNYAGSLAKGMKMSVDDPYFDLAGARNMMMLFEDGFNYMVIAHDQLSNVDTRYRVGTYGPPGGANWQLSHDYDAYIGNY